MIVSSIHVLMAFAVCLTVSIFLNPLSFPLLQLLFEFLGLDERALLTSPGTTESRLLSMYDPLSTPSKAPPQKNRLHSCSLVSLRLDLV